MKIIAGTMNIHLIITHIGKIVQFAKLNSKNYTFQIMTELAQLADFQ